jgi:hypothetical protein
MRFKLCPTPLRTVALVAAAAASLTTIQTSHASAAQKSRGAKASSQRRDPGKLPPKPQQTPQPTPASGATAQQLPPPTLTVRWKGQPGVERYRLQIARDAGFADIVFDQAVSGREHAVSLPSGNYFWRVAPAVGETGSYSQAQSVEVVGGGSVADERSVVVTSGDTGWRTATGEVPRLVPVRLRAGRGLDLVGVNTDGTAYGIDGTTGVAIWTARYNPAARRGDAADTTKAPLFAPLALDASGGASNVVVAYEGGVRALRGELGTELWRASFAGRATGGLVTDLDGDGKQEIVVSTAEPSTLVVLAGDSGRVMTTARLDAPTVGAPALFESGAERGVAVSLASGSVEVRGKGGELLRSAKLDSAATTAPLVLNTPRGVLVVVGVERGLAALDAAELKMLGKIVTEDVTPHGTLAQADVDGDGTQEILMVTRGGRVALIGTSDGQIRWVSEGAKDADSVALADLNGDGVLDVITAAGASLASGFSGKDGALIWRVREETGRGAQEQPQGAWPRALAIVLSQTEGAFLVGGDPSRTGLRAVELPKGSVKTASK